MFKDVLYQVNVSRLQHILLSNSNCFFLAVSVDTCA